MSNLRPGGWGFNSETRPRYKSLIPATINPFEHKIKLTPLRKILVFLMSFTLAPIKILVMTVMFLITWFFASFWTWGMQIPAIEPVGRLRKFLFNILRVMARLGLFFFGFHWIQVRGKRASSLEAPILVVAPHSSLFDVIVLIASNPLPSCVSRIENYYIPFLGTICKILQPVFVDRSDPESRVKTIDEIQRRVYSFDEWPQIMIFPEGTCTNRKALITFKAGAFIPGVTIQPVIIEYLNALDTFSWPTKGPSALTSMWLSCCQLSLKARLTYLPVYHPSQEEMENPKLYAHNVREAMAEALNIPSTEHTFEDCKLMRHAARLNLPMEAGLVEFTKISQKLGMNIEDVHDKLLEFSKIACERRDGLVTLPDFAKFLNLPITPPLEEMFRLYDRTDSGRIDFREYVIGLSLVSQPAVTEDTVKLAFMLFDRDHKGIITENEFNRVLKAIFGNEIKGSEIFGDIKKAQPNRVTFEEFHSFVVQRPEYAKLFLWYYDIEEDYYDTVDSKKSSEFFKYVDRNSVFGSIQYPEGFLKAINRKSLYHSVELPPDFFQPKDRRSLFYGIQYPEDFLKAKQRRSLFHSVQHPPDYYFRTKDRRSVFQSVQYSDNYFQRIGEKKPLVRRRYVRLHRKSNPSSSH